MIVSPLRYTEEHFKTKSTAMNRCDESRSTSSPSAAASLILHLRFCLVNKVLLQCLSRHYSHSRSGLVFALLAALLRSNQQPFFFFLFFSFSNVMHIFFSLQYIHSADIIHRVSHCCFSPHFFHLDVLCFCQCWNKVTGPVKICKECNVFFFPNTSLALAIDSVHESLHPVCHIGISFTSVSLLLCRT